MRMTSSIPTRSTPPVARTESEELWTRIKTVYSTDAPTSLPFLRANPVIRILTCVAVLLVSPLLRAQSTLDDDHYRVIDPRMAAHEHTNYLLNDDPRVIKSHFGYDAFNKEVIISWTAYVADGSHDHVVESFPTAYIPLATSPEAGTSDTLYVIGWAERSSELVVERWHMHSALIGETVGPGGSTLVTLTPPRVTKDELLRANRGPCHGAVFHPYSRKLLLLCDVTGGSSPTETEIVSVDVDSATPAASTLYSASKIGALHYAGGIDLGVTRTSNAVYMFLFDDHLVSTPTSLGDIDTELATPSQYAHVFCDADQDGAFETSYEDGYVAVSLMGSSISWTQIYTSSVN